MDENSKNRAECKTNPHLKLGDTNKAVKHLIRALRRSSMAYFFIKPTNSGWCFNNALKHTRYRHYTHYLKQAVWGFQIREGLPRTGECDAATWAKLERFL